MVSRRGQGPQHTLHPRAQYRPWNTVGAQEMYQCIFIQPPLLSSERIPTMKLERMRWLAVETGQVLVGLLSV